MFTNPSAAGIGKRGDSKTEAFGELAKLLDPHELTILLHRKCMRPEDRPPKFHAGIFG